MELRHLRYFIVVAEEGSFTRAALRLGMQQPPLSQQIRALEQELGFELFVRHPKGASLTAGGSVFLHEAKAILDSVEQGAARAARAASGTEATISLGLTSSAAAHPLIPKIIRSFRALRPNVQIDFTDGNAEELTHALVNKRLDLAFIRLPVGKTAGLTYIQLLQEEMLLVLPLGHPLLRKQHGRSMPTISLKDLKGEQFILVRRRGSPGLYSNLIGACVRAGFSPQIAAEVDRMMTGISLVAAGAGISAVPASMKGVHEADVVYCRIAQGGADLIAPLSLMHQEEQPGPAIATFIEVATRTVEPARIARERVPQRRK